jgi:phosphatidylserine decarboxylase
MTFLEFLYGTAAGRVLLKPLTAPALSHLAGRILDHPVSKILIPGFVSRNHIPMEEYQETSYHSFNDFFCRKIKPSLRPIDPLPEHLIAPCDGLLSVYPISQDLVIPVKQSRYTISSLLRNSALAKKFEGGYCMVFRLCVDHYHRYCYPDSCEVGKTRCIKGILHTVNPVSAEFVKVYHRNTRTITMLSTAHFGHMLQIEVGAMFVGKIVNHPHGKRVARGIEKGYFEFGGSTVVLVLEKGAAEIMPQIIENSENGAETVVKYGSAIGKAAGAE